MIPTLLIVDADPDTLRLLQSELENRADARVERATTVADALARIAGSNPSLVMLSNRLRTRESGSDALRSVPGGAALEGDILPFEEQERRILLHALEHTGWNVQEAARRLGIGRATVYRKIDRYDLRRYRPHRNAG